MFAGKMNDGVTADDYGVYKLTYRISCLYSRPYRAANFRV